MVATAIERIVSGPAIQSRPLTRQLSEPRLFAGSLRSSAQVCLRSVIHFRILATRLCLWDVLLRPRRGRQIRSSITRRGIQSRQLLRRTPCRRTCSVRRTPVHQYELDNAGSNGEGRHGSLSAGQSPIPFSIIPIIPCIRFQFDGLPT
jgi:hypothetical protein